MDKNEVFTEQFSVGRRTYFFNLMKAKNGELYLKIVESVAENGGFKKHFVMVFEEGFEEFEHCLERVFKVVKKRKSISK